MQWFNNAEKLKVSIWDFQTENNEWIGFNKLVQNKNTITKSKQG